MAPLVWFTLFQVFTTLCTATEIYPDGHSSEIHLKFDVKNSRGTIGRGFAFPISAVGGDYCQRSTWSSSMPANISYRISLIPASGMERTAPFNTSSNEYYRHVEIVAEGIYNAETGRLSMFGCRTVGSSLDCEIRVTVQFPSLRDPFDIVGNISSARNLSDPLYFEAVSIYYPPIIYYYKNYKDLDLYGAFA